MTYGGDSIKLTQVGGSRSFFGPIVRESTPGIVSFLHISRRSAMHPVTVALAQFLLADLDQSIIAHSEEALGRVSKV